DAENSIPAKIEYANNTLQPNDILDVKIGALVPETAIPYNNLVQKSGQALQDIELIKLQGYLVGTDGYIVLPILGRILVANKTIASVEKELIRILENDQHLISPSVSVRLLNAKVTILGEVNRPGTYNFTEQFISIPQALGYAGDLTIQGKRTDIILVREQEGTRTSSRIDLTTTNWMNNPEYRVMPNDVIVVNPNITKVKSSGIVGNASVVMSIVTTLLSITVLLTR
ncbi:MAG: polysaccharide biosynthesis/export family protein, partial [Polaribacter sp.]|nr:polysaccharide biosynthesis/export family protein [Polaribacter sp.]